MITGVDELSNTAIHLYRSEDDSVGNPTFCLAIHLGDSAIILDSISPFAFLDLACAATQAAQKLQQLIDERDNEPLPGLGIEG